MFNCTSTLSWRERWNVPNAPARNAFPERCERLRSARARAARPRLVASCRVSLAVVRRNGVVAAGGGAWVANPGTDPNTIHQVGHLSLGVVYSCWGAVHSMRGAWPKQNFGLSAWSWSEPFRERSEWPSRRTRSRHVANGSKSPFTAAQTGAATGCYWLLLAATYWSYWLLLGRHVAHRRSPCEPWEALLALPRPQGRQATLPTS